LTLTKVRFQLFEAVPQLTRATRRAIGREVDPTQWRGVKRLSPSGRGACRCVRGPGKGSAGIHTSSRGKSTPPAARCASSQTSPTIPTPCQY